MQGFYEDYNAEYGGGPQGSYVVVIGYDEVNIVKAAIQQAESAEPADIIAALASVDHTGGPGHAVMDLYTRRVDKSAVIGRELERGDVHLLAGNTLPKPRSARVGGATRSPATRLSYTPQALSGLNASRSLTDSRRLLTVRRRRCRSVSLEVAAGGTVAVLGPNGAGEDYVAPRGFAGAEPQSGMVTFDGCALAGMAPEDVVRCWMVLVPLRGATSSPSSTVGEEPEPPSGRIA